MKKIKGMNNIDIIMLICNILLIICFINLKHHSVSDIITIIGLISFSVVYGYNNDFVRKLVYGQQYKIMRDIKKIIKVNKKNDIKIILNEIEDYYNNPKNNYSIEEYLSRSYKLENNYVGIENFKYSGLAGIIMLGVTEISQEFLYHWNKNKLIISLIIGIGIITFIMLVIFKGISFLFFYPTVDRGLNKIINDRERKVVNKKINEICGVKELV